MLHHTLTPLVFVLAGTFNILVIKWSDITQAECSDGKIRHFQHPIVQTALMFFGELLCFFVYKMVYLVLERRGDYSENENIITRGGREFPMRTLLVAAFLDAIASVLLFTALYLTYASSFQMLRGGAIIFVAIFSSIYLNQPLTTRHWMAMITVICGLVILICTDIQRVSYDSASIGHSDAGAILTGDLLVLCAQVLHAFKWVYEEKNIKNFDIPALQAVGWQGIFGLVITALLAAAMNFLPTPSPMNQNAHGVFDDIPDAIVQLRTHPSLLVPLLSFVIFSACYNFVGLHIIKISSTSNRILADGLRVIFIWVFALLLEWEYVNIITILAFIILQMGAIDYRRAIFISWYRALLGQLAARRYDNLERDQGNTDGDRVVPTVRAADVI